MEIKTAHNWRCEKFYDPRCPCLTCGRDNYRQKSFRQCCQIHNRDCGSSKKCRDYLPEGGVAEDKREPDNTEQLNIFGLTEENIKGV